MKVLLVEDNPILGEALRDHVRAKGHSVDWRMNFAGGMNEWRDGGYDLVLLDLRLPDGDGLSILRAIRKSDFLCWFVARKYLPTSRR